MAALALKLRGPMIAVVVLLLSAGLALAGGGILLPDGGGGDATMAQTDDADQDADGPDGTDADGTDADEDGWDTHGDMVSEAAQMADEMVGPDKFRNRGAFVSCVAKLQYGKKGVEAPADFDLAALTPDDCSKAEAERGQGKDKAKKSGKAHGKHDR